jgi:DNA-binding CsgD family transcriptional regulator
LRHGSVPWFALGTSPTLHADRAAVFTQSGDTGSFEDARTGLAARVAQDGWLWPRAEAGGHDRRVTSASARSLAARTPGHVLVRGSAAGRMLRFGVPVALVLATIVLADNLRWVFPGGGLFLLLLLPVIVAAIALGAAAGELTLALGVAGAVLMVVLGDHPWLTEGTDALRIVPYVLIGGVIVLVVSALERASANEEAPSVHDAPHGLIEPLTEREQEVLGLAASGLSVGRIGASLSISPNTVKSHLAHAYSKLGAHNRAEAVAAALHSGTIDGSVVTARAPEITRGMTRSPLRLPLVRQ